MKLSFGWIGIGVGLVVAGGAVGAVKLRSERPIIVINGEKVPRGAFIAELERQYGANVLRRMIHEKLVMQEAKKRNLLPTQQAVDAEIAKMREVEPDLDRQLRVTGKTKEDLFTDIQGRLAVASLIAAGVKLPEGEVKKFYDTNQKKFTRPEGRKIAMVLAKTAKDGDKARKMLVDGVPAEFAAQNEGLGLPGGRSQIIVSRGQLPASFEKQLFALKAGSVSDVLALGRAFAVVRMIEEMPAKNRTFDEVKSELELGAKIRKGKSEPELIQALIKTAKIDVKSDRYKGLVDAALAARDPRLAQRKQPGS